MAVLIPFSVLVMLFMPYVMRVMAWGWYENYPDKYDLAINFSLITFPYLTLISITALQTGVLNAQGIFGPGAAAPIALNIVMVAGLIIAKIFHLHVGYTLSWALTLSGVVQMGWLVISCYRSGVPIPLIWPRMTEASRRLFRRIGPGSLGAGAAQINLFISTILAASLSTGAVSWLYYADRLNQLPLGIVGIAVATTLLPVLSRHVEAGQEDQVRHYMSRAIEFCLVLGLPATVGLAVAGKPIIRTLWEHGIFGPADTQATADALAAYALGIPGFLLVKVFSAGFFARHDTATPVKIAFVAMTVNVVGSVIMIGPFQHVGIALANSIAIWVNAILLFTRLRRHRGPTGDVKLLHRAPRIFLCAAAMAGLTWALMQVTDVWSKSPHLLLKILGLSVIIGGASLGYGIMLQVTGAVNIRDILRAVRPRRVKRRETDEAVTKDITS
jgi:putative peptidoglycan lipid II flippase